MNDARGNAVTEHNYEFTVEENELIADLAWKMKGVGAFMFLISLLALIGAFASAASSRIDVAVGLVFVTAFFVAIASWTVLAGRSFRKIVDTEGHDIPHTMTALAQLRRFYTLHFWLILAYVVLIVLAIFGYPPGLG